MSLCRQYISCKSTYRNYNKRVQIVVSNWKMLRAARIKLSKLRNDLAWKVPASWFNLMLTHRKANYHFFSWSFLLCLFCTLDTFHDQILKDWIIIWGFFNNGCILHFACATCQGWFLSLMFCFIFFEGVLFGCFFKFAWFWFFRVFIKKLPTLKWQNPLQM